MQKAILPRPATTQFQHLLTCWNSMRFTSESSAKKKIDRLIIPGSWRKKKMVVIDGFGYLIDGDLNFLITMIAIYQSVITDGFYR